MLQVSSSQSLNATARNIVVKVKDKEFTGLDSQEVLNRIQSASFLIVHNSTQMLPGFFFRGGIAAGIFKDLSSENQHLLVEINKTVNDGLTRIAKAVSREFENFLEN